MNTSVDGGWGHDRNNGRLQFTKYLPETKTTGLLMSRYTLSCDVDAPEYGPAYRLKTNESFEAYRVYELFHSSSYFEWKVMEVRTMYQMLFPQTMDAPLIYHLISSDPDTVKHGIDQAANAGFNMVLLSFGSGVNCEDTSPANIEKYKALVDYAHQKGILLGSYMMQTTRGAAVWIPAAICSGL